MSRVQDLEENSFYGLLSAAQKGDSYASELLEMKLRILKGALMRNIQKAHEDLSMDKAIWLAELQMGETEEIVKSIKSNQMDAMWDVFKEELVSEWKTNEKVDDFWGILSRIGGHKFVSLMGVAKKLKFEVPDNLAEILKKSPADWGCLFLMQHELVVEFLAYSEVEDMMVTVRVSGQLPGTFGTSAPDVEWSTFTAFIVRNSVVHILAQDYLEKTVEDAGLARSTLSCCGLMEFEDVRLFLADRNWGASSPKEVP